VIARPPSRSAAGAQDQVHLVERKGQVQLDVGDRRRRVERAAREAEPRRTRTVLAAPSQATTQS